MGKLYSSPMVAMIKLSEASVTMWLLLLRFQELLQHQCYIEHLLSVMSGSLGKIKNWTHYMYSESIEPTNIVIL